jgi:hypothetical protein
MTGGASLAGGVGLALIYISCILRFLLGWDQLIQFIHTDLLITRGTDARLELNRGDVVCSDSLARPRKSWQGLRRCVSWTLQLVVIGACVDWKLTGGYGTMQDKLINAASGANRAATETSDVSLSLLLQVRLQLADLRTRSGTIAPTGVSCQGSPPAALRTNIIER